MATGHFVRTDEEGRLLKGTDPNKDQSYFLYMVHAEQLKKAVFPVGSMTKAEVRAIAEKAIERKIGARGLRSILEDIMMDKMYEIPSDTEIKEYTVTSDMVK